MVLVIMIFWVVLIQMQTTRYSSDATADDGSCTYDVSGCTDSSANNIMQMQL